MSLGVLFSAGRTASDILHTAFTDVRPYQWYSIDAAVTCMLIWALLRRVRAYRRRLRTTQLRGPPSESFLYGVGKRILDAKDSGAVYEAWAKEYGRVYACPSTLGTARIVLCDPKAIAHFFAKGSWTYIHTSFSRKAIALIFGKGLAWAEGEMHKRQRKSLTPAFSIAAIRHLMSIFYDSAYKAKAAWDVLIESNGGDGAIIEVQSWMNHVSLDTVGRAGFSHNFGALEGKHVHVAEVLDAFSTFSRSTTLEDLISLFGLIFPIPLQLLTLFSRTKHFQKLSEAMGEISDVLLARTRKELETGVVGGEERSIIGLLIKGASSDSAYQLTKDEVVAQMKQLLLAGYETTSISLTWALLELSRNPDIQTRLRNELIEYGADPTYDEFTNGLPYLDAVVHETLRMYPPIVEFTRIANEDDVIPLSAPVYTKSGELVDRLTIAKGTLVVVSIESINRSTAIWGDDAKVFQPSRWLEDAQGRDGLHAKAKEIQGHRHLLTFADGPRTCLGKAFAVAEFKTVLAVLVKNFVFELRDGDDSKVEVGGGVLPRPRIAGEVGCKLPLQVRPYVV